MKREPIGKIVVQKGSYTLYMPTVNDIAYLDTEQPEYIYKLCAISLGIPYQEFRTWNMDDAHKVTEKLGKALVVLGAAI